MKEYFQSTSREKRGDNDLLVFDVKPLDGASRVRVSFAEGKAIKLEGVEDGKARVLFSSPIPMEFHQVGSLAVKRSIERVIALVPTGQSLLIVLESET